MRLRQTTDERGIVADYFYNTGDRLNLVSFPAFPAHNLSATYDWAGRPLTITDSAGQTQFGYDPVHKRLTSFTRPLGTANPVASYTDSITNEPIPEIFSVDT